MHPDAAALPQPPDPPPTLGVDLARHVFQVCMTAAGGQPPRNRAYSRDDFMKLLGRLPPGSAVAFEARSPVTTGPDTAPPWGLRCGSFPPRSSIP